MGLQYDMSDWEITSPDLLALHYRQLEVDERIDAEGNVVDSVDHVEVRELVSTLAEDHGVLVTTDFDSARTTAQGSTLGTLLTFLVGSFSRELVDPTQLDGGDHCVRL